MAYISVLHPVPTTPSLRCITAGRISGKTNFLWARFLGLLFSHQHFSFPRHVTLSVCTVLGTHNESPHTMDDWVQITPKYHSVQFHPCIAAHITPGAWNSSRVNQAISVFASFFFFTFVHNIIFHARLVNFSGGKNIHSPICRRVDTRQVVINCPHFRCVCVWWIRDIRVCRFPSRGATTFALSHGRSNVLWHIAVDFYAPCRTTYHSRHLYGTEWNIKVNSVSGESVRR